MIYYVAKSRHQYTWRRSMESAYSSRADPTIRKELFERVVFLPYEKLFKLRRLPLGSYVFSDLERLSREETERAGIVWRTLAAVGRDVRLFNNPVSSMRRYELLRYLYEDGTNTFNVQRLTEPFSLKRFPVFIRSESDHAANITPLLNNREEYDSAVRDIVDSGKAREDKIVVEYIDTRDHTGLFHKFTAIVADAQVKAIMVAHRPDWVVKKMADHPDDQLAIRQEYKVHETEILRIFRLANIDYGRIDYAVVDNKLQVFEINTNPSLGVLQHLVDVTRALDIRASSGRIAVTQEYCPPWEEEKKKSWNFTVSRQLHLSLRKMGLLEYESVILKKASEVKNLFQKNRIDSRTTRSG